jgi:hypothetical protein
MTSFTSAGFKAAGAPTRRTIPTRLSEIVNVKDWGAVGDGVHDDSGAINSAINYLYNVHPGILFFPPGIYYCGTTPIDIAPAQGHYTFELIGSGRDATVIKGKVDNPAGNPPIGYWDNLSGSMGQVLSVAALVRTGTFGETDPTVTINFPDMSFVIRDMTIWNTSTDKWSCALQLNPVQAGTLVQNCRFVGNCGLAMGGFGGSVINCSAISSSIYVNRTTSTFPAANAFVPPVGTVVYHQVYTGNTPQLWAAGTGIAHSQGPIIGCDVTGFDAGFLTGSVSKYFVGNSASRCGVGVAGGDTWTWSGHVGGKGLISGCKIDRCQVGLDAGSYDVCGNIISGAEAPPEPAAIDSISGSGTITAHTHVAHNLAAGATSLVLDDGAGHKTVVSCTNTGATTFTYSSASYAFTPITWNYSCESAVTGGSASRTLAANVLSAVCASASVSFGSSGGETDVNSVAMAMEGAYRWLPINSDNRTRNSWAYEMCGTTGTDNNPLLPYLTFNALPPNSAPARLVAEGQQFWITDGPSVALGANVTSGGGGNKIGVRYNGSNWTRFA